MDTKITARNYAAQVVRDFAIVTKHYREIWNLQEDADKVDSIANIIKDAQHFVLPDGGNIFSQLPRPKGQGLGVSPSAS